MVSAAAVLVYLGFAFLRQQKIRRLLAYLFLSAFPYFISSQAQIWHLLPIMIPMSLLIPGVFVELTNRFVPSEKLKQFSEIILLFAISLIGLVSMRSYWGEIFDLPKQVANEARMGQLANRVDLPLYVQDTTYLPAIIFYADKEQVNIIRRQDDITLIKRPFQLISRDFLVNQTKGFSIVDQIGEMVLVRYD